MYMLSYYLWILESCYSTIGGNVNYQSAFLGVTTTPFDGTHIDTLVLSHAVIDCWQYL